MLTLYTSKTHGRGSRPQKIKITSVNIKQKCNRRIFCPVRVVLKFMKLRGPFKNKMEQLFIFRERSPVKPEHFRYMLRILLNRLGLNGDLYDIHSFRSGRTVDLAKYGYSIDQIKAMG